MPHFFHVEDVDAIRMNLHLPRSFPSSPERRKMDGHWMAGKMGADDIIGHGKSWKLQINHQFWIFSHIFPIFPCLFNIWVLFHGPLWITLDHQGQVLLAVLPRKGFNPSAVACESTGLCVVTPRDKAFFFCWRQVGG